MLQQKICRLQGKEWGYLEIKTFNVPWAFYVLDELIAYIFRVVEIEKGK
jgi:hypothetical protein